MITDQKLYNGASGKWTESFSDYPASLYDLQIFLKQSTTDAYELVIEKSGDDFNITYNAAMLQPGENQFQYLFTELSTGNKSVAFDGYVTVNQILGEGDQRNDDQIILDSLIDARKRLAGREYVQITINGKATTFKDALKLDQEIVHYKKKLGIYKTPRILNQFR